MAILISNIESGDEPPDYTEPNRCTCGREIEWDESYCSLECSLAQHDKWIDSLIGEAR
jgi:hypothetical protein